MFSDYFKKFGASESFLGLVVQQQANLHRFLVFIMKIKFLMITIEAARKLRPVPPQCEAHNYNFMVFQLGLS